jgi:hypothetical protein
MAWSLDFFVHVKVTFLFLFSCREEPWALKAFIIFPFLCPSVSLP